MRSNTCSIVESPILASAISVDTLEQIFIEQEKRIARHRAIQIEVLQMLDEAQVATADGARNLTEWVAARGDLSLDESRRLVRTTRLTERRPELRQWLHDGDVTFDRVTAVARLDGKDPDPLLRHLDVEGVHREAARRTRIGSEAVQRSAADNFLVLQPNLDESWWKGWLGLDAVTGALVDTALTRMSDTLPKDPEVPQDSSWRKAMALAQVCMGDEAPAAQVTVFVDTDQATRNNGEAGVYLQAGPRVGREVLEAVLCDSVTRVTAIEHRGEPMRYGRRRRIVPEALRHAILRRDGNRCAIDGCDSRNRLQIHHIVPWSQGGRTDPGNLITVCWFHHHIAIHQHRLEPYRHPDHGRWRLRPVSRPPPR
jgi:hypothetical protein